MLSARTMLPGLVIGGCVVVSVTFAQSPNISTYLVSGSPLGITKGPDGALWFTEYYGNKVGRITTAGAVNEYPLPPAEGVAALNPYGIATGPDGALWFANSSAGSGGPSLGRITTSGNLTLNVIPQDCACVDITTGPDGGLWFTELNGIGRSTTSGSLSSYPISGLVASPFSITTGPDGALWFTEANRNGANGSIIGRIDTSGRITLYPVPTPNADIRGITQGPDGALWFAEYAASRVGRITTAGVVTEYVLQSERGPFGITAGPDGALWFTENAGKIGRITTAGAITEYDHQLGSGGFITTGPDGALWFTGSSGIGRIGVAQTGTTRSSVLSHIAAGGIWTTVITLVNRSPAAVPVTVAFRNDDGSAWSLPLSTTSQGTTQSSTSSSVTATINPNATLLISTGQLASTFVGWADVNSSGSVSGFAIFRATSSNSPISEGTVPLQAQFPSTVTLAFDNTAGFLMGIALANLSSATANITATIWDDNGNQLGTQNLTLAGSGHTSFVLPNQILLTAGKRGVVQFQSGASGGLAGLGFRFSPFGTFTSVPPL